MPRYDYRCRACGDTFEISRPMCESDAPASCPNGHDDTVKLPSAVAVGGRTTIRAGSASASASAGGGCGGGGGCCGGACRR